MAVTGDPAPPGYFFLFPIFSPITLVTLIHLRGDIRTSTTTGTPMPSFPPAQQEATAMPSFPSASPPAQVEQQPDVPVDPEVALAYQQAFLLQVQARPRLT